MLITDSLLLDYKRCSRRAFLNIHGDPKQQDVKRDFLLKLRQENQRHISLVLAEFYPHYQRPDPSGNSRLEKAQATETLMQQGVECIYQGTLWSSNLSLSKSSTYYHQYLGKPHLLIKQPGESKFGKWYYYPVSIHLGRRA